MVRGMTETAPDSAVVWLTRREAAARLRITERTLERYQKKGLIRPYLLPGGERRWKPAELDALLHPRPDETEDQCPTT